MNGKRQQVQSSQANVMVASPPQREYVYLIAQLANLLILKYVEAVWLAVIHVLVLLIVIYPSTKNVLVLQNGTHVQVAVITGHSRTVQVHYVLVLQTVYSMELMNVFAILDLNQISLEHVRFAKNSSNKVTSIQRISQMVSPVLK